MVWNSGKKKQPHLVPSMPSHTHTGLGITLPSSLQAGGALSDSTCEGLNSVAVLPVWKWSIQVARSHDRGPKNVESWQLQPLLCQLLGIMMYFEGGRAVLT